MVGLSNIIILNLVTIITLYSSPTIANEENINHKTYIESGLDNKITYYDNEYKDDFSWIRDKSYPVIDDQKVLKFIEKERTHTSTFFENNKDLLNNVFEEIKERRKKIKEQNYSDTNFLYTSTYIGNNNYKTHFYTDLTTGLKKVLIDEQIRAKNYTSYKLLSYKISPNKKTLAWIEDTTGNDIGTLFIHDLITGKTDEKTIHNVGSSLEWADDSTSLYYVSTDKTGRRNQIYNHVLSGSDLDTLIYEDNDLNFWVGLSKSVDGKAIFVKSYSWTSTETYLLDNDKSNNPQLKLLIGRHQQTEHNINYIDGIYYIYSNHQGAEFALYKSKKLPSHYSNWELVVKNEGGGSFSNIIFFKDYFVIPIRNEGLDSLLVINRESGKKHFVDFGESIIGLSFYNVNQNNQSDIVRVSLQSSITPKTIYDYDLTKRELKVVSSMNIKGYDKSKYITKRLSIPSFDGVEVPVTIIYHKKYGFNKHNPLYLYVYGAYGNGIAPEFPVIALSAIDRGFTYAIVHARGGDELGQQWHEQGRLFNRKNTFKDFISTAQYFVDNKLATKGNLFASGESAAGTVIGYAVNERPGLFRSVASLVPYVDVLNSLMDHTMTLTPTDWTEYGNPRNDEKVFDYIKSYSPYDNIKKQIYPSIYVTAGLNDHAVGYWEPPKWIAKIRSMQSNESDTYVDFREGGHVKSGKYESEFQFAKLITFLIVTAK
ncbi:MAG: oligopeptidase B [Colwellia sp.]|jgi:oligopeptidase B